MKKFMKKAILILTAILVIGWASDTAWAHGHGKGHHKKNPVAYCLCDTEGCNETEIHLHDGIYYYGHFCEDGHDYHEVCTMKGCTETTEHEHNDKIYLPCHDGNCYNGKCLNGKSSKVKRRCHTH